MHFVQYIHWTIRENDVFGLNHGAGIGKSSSDRTSNTAANTAKTL